MIISAAASILLGLVLAGSGLLKLRTPGSLREWAALGVPRILLKKWMVALHPWFEVALGIALLGVGGAPRVVGAVVALLLLIGYTLVLWNGWRAAASCGCFGAVKPVTGVHIIRNLWLLVLAVGALLGGATLPHLGGAVRAVASGSWPTLVAAVATAITVVLILVEPSTEDEPVPKAEQVQEDPQNDTDYVRLRTPNVPVTAADGTVLPLRQLAAEKPVLLIGLTEGCGPCQSIYWQISTFREQLPPLDVRLLLYRNPDVSEYTEDDGLLSLHDPHGYVHGSFDEWGAPAAVLLGVDGMLAGGPVLGMAEIEQFVEDIRAELKEAGLVE